MSNKVEKIRNHSILCTDTHVQASYSGKEEKILPTELILINYFKTAILNLLCTGLFSLLLTVILSELHQEIKDKKLS